MENFDYRGDINRDWENFRENVKISAQDCLGQYERKLHKPWFDNECSEFVDRRKQPRLEWLQTPAQNYADNLNHVVPKNIKYFMKEAGIFERKIYDLVTNSKKKY